MPARRVLVVEDDGRLRALIARELRSAGYLVDAVASGGEALARLVDGDVDLVLLDLNLPDVDGVEVAERIRRDGSDVPIVMVTARGDVDSRVNGLYAGASDYLVKPFEVSELLARVHVRLREAGSSGVLRHEALTFDVDAACVRVGDRALQLPPREAELLRLLLAHRGRVYAVAELERRLYGAETPASNTVEVYVSNLRRRLASLGADGLIVTVRGRGYVVP